VPALSAPHLQMPKDARVCMQLDVLFSVDRIVLCSVRAKARCRFDSHLCAIMPMIERVDGNKRRRHVDCGLPHLAIVAEETR
jgi:hypothetical protein